MSIQIVNAWFYNQKFHRNSCNLLHNTNNSLCPNKVMYTSGTTWGFRLSIGKMYHCSCDGDQLKPYIPPSFLSGHSHTAVLAVSTCTWMISITEKTVLARSPGCYLLYLNISFIWYYVILNTRRFLVSQSQKILSKQTLALAHLDCEGKGEG